MEIDPKVKNILGLEKVNQVGIVVRDMDKAIKNYWEIFGISFPKVLIPEYFNRVYRGKPENFRMKIGLAMVRDLQIELVQPLEGETTYGEFLEKWGRGSTTWVSMSITSMNGSPHSRSSESAS